MNINHCPACGSDRLRLGGVPELVEFKGLHVKVQTILSTTCESCGYSFATNDQHDENVVATRAAYVAQRAAVKSEKGLLTGAQLRAMREELGLSQKQASELFGGGPVAFSKYENEDVTQSVAMDRLVRLVHAMGPFGVRTLLAQIDTRLVVEAMTANAVQTIDESFVVTLTVPKAHSVKLIKQAATQTESHELTPPRPQQH